MTTVLIDTDTAGDDVTSLLLALRWPGIDLVGVTTVAGNVYLDEAVRNALYTVEVADRDDVPVHAGADRPLLRELVTAHYVHGEDGMGNSNFPAPGKTAEDEHAVDAIVRLATEHAGELEIVAQAPLTNLALALFRDPGLPGKIKRLWVMGGANNSLGNITPAAEFNFFVDPEAAHLVLNAGFEVTLVPWDVCVNDGILLRDELAPIEALDTDLSRFYLAVNKAAWDFVHRQYGIDGISHPDALVTAMLIDDRVVVERDRYFVDVEYKGELTAGYSVIDTMHVLRREPNADVVVRADKERFTQMLIQVLRS